MRLRLLTLCIHGLAAGVLFPACKPAACPTLPGGGDKTAGVGAPLRLDPYLAAPLSRAQRVEVDVLWVRTKGAKKDMRQGGLTRVRLLVAPNPQRQSRVGISEQFPGGAGDSWRASVWIAARTAARAVGREMADYRFLADSEGFIDGPSAGGLFTAGFLAALTGAKARPDVTMTGTVTPDGTIGPVTGLEEKLLAAIGAGKKLIGYPEGNKLVAGKGNQMVNLETLAAEKGAKAVPVRDIYEAYQLLTGQAFPRQARAAEAVLGFDKALADRLSQKAEGWRKEHVASVAATQRHLTDPLIRKFYESRAKAAKIYLDASVGASKARHPGAAFYSAVRAAQWAYTAQRFTDIVFLWKQWITLVQKEEATATAKFAALLAERTRARQRALEEEGCKKTLWKTPACRALRTQLQRDEAARKKAAMLARKAPRPTPGARPAGRPAPGARPAGRPTPGARPVGRPAPGQPTRFLTRPVGRPMPGQPTRFLTRPVGRPMPGQVAGPLARLTPAPAADQAPRVPPEPPQDFQKLLIEKAGHMDSRTKAIEAVTKKLGEVKPATVDQAIALIAAYEELVQGAAFAQVARARLGLLKRYDGFRQMVQNAWAKRRMLVETTTYVDETVKFAGIALGKSRLAEELAQLFGAGSRPVAVSDERMKSLSSQLFAAAKANLDYVHSLMPSGFGGMIVRQRLASSSPEYVIAQLGMNQAGQLVFKFREAGERGKRIELGSGWAALGAAVASFMASSKLIAKVVTLGIQHKTGGEVTGVKRPMELTNSLHRARLFALEAAQRAHVSTGVVPVFGRVLLETAEQYRQESLSGQVKALELYWRAALYCQVAEMLLRR